ncbi:SETMR methyltransferase, partial [Acromyrmex heyeri]
MEQRNAQEIQMTTPAVTQHVKPLIFLSSKNFELMIHCPYSPDLSLNDFFLFPNIKKKMRGERFESPEAAVETFRTLISEITASEWKKCFENWFERMQKCIDLKGKYF